MGDPAGGLREMEGFYGGLGSSHKLLIFLKISCICESLYSCLQIHADNDGMICLFN